MILFDFPLNPVDYLHRIGRTARAGRIGRVTALVTKKDRVLADAIKVTSFSSISSFFFFEISNVNMNDDS